MKTAVCLVCTTPEQKLIAKRQNVSIFACSNCGITFAVGEEKRSNIDTVVDTDPDFYESTKREFSQQLQQAKKILPGRIEEYNRLLGRPCKKVLEVGCGTGAYAKAFDEIGVSYTAVELDPQIAKFATENSGSRIINADFNQFETEDSFDVVFASQVFEHILEPDAFLTKAIELAPGGLLHLDVPNHQSLVASIRKITSKTEYGFIQPPYHMIAYTPDVLQNRLKQNRFQDVEVFQPTNDHKIWGQLTSNPNFLTWSTFRAAQLLGRGSLLTALARMPS